MIAIGIDGIDFSQPLRYFDIILIQVSRPLGSMPIENVIPLESCNYSKWKDEG